MSGLDYKTARQDRLFWGRLVENAVGALLYFRAVKSGNELFYWRERDNEVDYVIKGDGRILGLEIKSGVPDKPPAALNVFAGKYKNSGIAIISSSAEKQINNIKNINLAKLFENPEKEIFA
jgi:predicted AAA+ superfamily ATPase